MIKDFLKDFAIYGLATALSKLIVLFMMPIYTNVLTQAEYGAMALIVSVSGILDLFSNLNIHSGICRDYYEKGINRTTLVSTGVISIFSVSVFVCVVMLLTSSFWMTTVLNISDYKGAFVIMLLTMPATSLHTYFSLLTRFKKKPVLYSIGTIIQILIQITVSIIGVVVLRKGIPFVFWGILCGLIFSVVYNGFINRSDISISFNASYLKRALIFSIPTLPAILAGWLDNSFGQVLIGKSISLEELGVYSVAVTLASAFNVIGNSFHNVWSPFLYENYQKDSFSKEVGLLYKILTYGLLLIAVTLSLLSKEIVLLFSNSSYIKASEYFVLLCIPMIFLVVLPIASSGVSISRDTKYIGLSNVTGSAVNIVLLLLCLSRWGIIMVPICLALSRIINYTILYVATKRMGLFSLPYQNLIYIIVSLLVCYIVICLNIHILWRSCLLLGFMIYVLYELREVQYSKLIDRIIGHKRNNT